MGVVYRALEPQLGRMVALKVLKGAERLGDRARRRFLQEARSAAALTHPGVTTIYRVGQVNTVPYIAMEWIEGPTVADILETDENLDVPTVVRIGVELLDTLVAAHAKGIVHRDIKPSNLMILRDGRLKVTDFGVARMSGSDLVTTAAGTMMGTPRYASPEQFAGRAVDGRSDLFSVAVVLYHLLTGRFPFPGKTILEIASSGMNSKPMGICDVFPAVPPSLESAILRSLERDPSDRFQNAAEMASALRPFTDPAAGSGRLSELSAATSSRGDPSSSSDHRLVRPVPKDLRAAVPAVVKAWPGRELGRLDSRDLIRQLMEHPLHVPPFSGGAILGPVCLLFFEGRILGAVNRSTGEVGDAAVESVEDQADTHLRNVPDSIPARVIPLLATLLNPPRPRHEDLDSSFVEPPALSRRLSEERFSGVVRLTRKDELGLILLDRGHPVLRLFSEGWQGLPVDRAWSMWAHQVPLRINVEEVSAPPAFATFRHELRSYALQVRADDGEAAESRSRWASWRTRSSGGMIDWRIAAEVDRNDGDDLELLRARDPINGFLEALLKPLAETFEERGRTQRWKYLAGWIPRIRRALLHHELERPGSRETDLFDLVTAADDGQILHVVRRSARGEPAALRSFIDDVMANKVARIKSGDIGGAIFIAPSFPDDTLELYRRAIVAGSKSLQESVTKYEGFVRVGATRGFHLLLVCETPSGFAPILSI
jgi:serine/threonine-protein kinase